LPSYLKKAYGTEIVLTQETSPGTFIVQSSKNVPNDPYLAHLAGSNITLGPVYRVYYDELQAFMSGILPNGTTGRYKYANTNTMSDSTVGIPVPSRLYSISATTASKPFNGLRVTVKDVIDIDGVKTSNGNRAWFKLYAAVNATAPAVQRLVDMGASLIGRPKLRSLRTLIELLLIGWIIMMLSTPEETGTKTLVFLLREQVLLQLGMTGLMCPSVRTQGVVFVFQHQSRVSLLSGPRSARSRQMV
jgi:hypothetical protein